MPQKQRRDYKLRFGHILGNGEYITIEEQPPPPLRNARGSADEIDYTSENRVARTIIFEQETGPNEENKGGINACLQRTNWYRIDKNSLHAIQLM